MERFENQYEYDLETWNIRKEEIEDKIRQEEFNLKMDIKSLKRKIEYYTRKLIDDKLNKENIEDIIEKTVFELGMLEKTVDRSIRSLRLELFDIEQNIKEL